MDRFCVEAAKSGVDGALITDLTVEEASEYRRLMASHNLETILLAAHTSPDQRIKASAEACKGFVYAVSRTGITGTQKQVAADVQGLVNRIRKFTKLPVAVGFGISNAQQFAQVGQFADGVAVGSAIVQLIEQNPGREAQAVESFVRGLKSGIQSAATSQS
jgi:tryptophan synthase alpha chain